MRVMWSEFCRWWHADTDGWPTLIVLVAFMVVMWAFA